MLLCGCYVQLPSHTAMLTCEVSLHVLSIMREATLSDVICIVACLDMVVL